MGSQPESPSFAPLSRKPPAMVLGQGRTGPPVPARRSRGFGNEPPCQELPTGAADLTGRSCPHLEPTRSCRGSDLSPPAWQSESQRWCEGLAHNPALEAYNRGISRTIMAITKDAFVAALGASIGSARRHEQPYRHWFLQRCIPEDAVDPILALPFPAP